MTNYIEHSFQLMDLATRSMIAEAGGVCFVCTDGTPDLATLYDPANNFASLANPFSLTRGRGRFAVADTVNQVDLYIKDPKGFFRPVYNLKAQTMNEVAIDRLNRRQLNIVPFSFASGVATEVDSGMDFVTNEVVLWNDIGAIVTALDAGETIDVGLLSTEAGGDANGFMSLLSVAALGYVQARVAHTVGGTESFLASSTLGALLNYFLAGADAAGDVGTWNPFNHRIDGTAVSLSWTITAGSDTGKGFLLIPSLLTAVF